MSTVRSTFIIIIIAMKRLIHKRHRIGLACECGQYL